MIVHSLADAVAALRAAAEAAVPITILSAPGAAGYAGPAWFAKLVDLAIEKRPGVQVTAVLDCADAPGHALAALRCGARTIRFTGSLDVARRLADIAGQYGATVVRDDFETLDLATTTDPYAATCVWIRQRGGAVT